MARHRMRGACRSSRALVRSVLAGAASNTKNSPRTPNQLQYLSQNPDQIELEAISAILRPSNCNWHPTSDIQFECLRTDARHLRNRIRVGAGIHLGPLPIPLCINCYIVYTAVNALRRNRIYAYFYLEHDAGPPNALKHPLLTGFDRSYETCYDLN
jgi:hypothetical protein